MSLNLFFHNIKQYQGKKFVYLKKKKKKKLLNNFFFTGALSICGYGVNHLDIAPQYASVLMGLSNTVATIPGIISPLIAGFIVTEQTNANQWKWIFIMTSCVYLFGCLIYWFFASGELQSWAKGSDGNADQNMREVEKKSETETTRF